MSVIAICCWCGRPFKQGRVLRSDVWACQTEACFERCWKWAIRYRKASDKAKDGLGVERLFWLPLPRQAELMEAVERGERRILIGGARGGSKSQPRLALKLARWPSPRW